MAEYEMKDSLGCGMPGKFHTHTASTPTPTPSYPLPGSVSASAGEYPEGAFFAQYLLQK